MKKSMLAIMAAVVLVAVVSVAVLKSSDNDSRRQGALEGNEAVALSWRSEWSDAAEYVRGNVVSHEGVSYVAEGEKLGKPDAECAECGWALLATSDQAAAPQPPAPTTITSPNGDFKIEVTDTGILLDGPGANPSIRLTSDSLEVHLQKSMSVRTGLNIDLNSALTNINAGGGFTIQGGGASSVASGLLRLGCANAGRPVPRLGDAVSNGSISSASQVVHIC